MRYPVVIKPDGAGWFISFPDIPEALTSGGTEQQALELARDALATAMDFYVEDRRLVPPPSRVKASQPFVELPASLAAKVLLLNEMIRQKVRPADLARKLEVKPQEINRLIDLKHASKIDGVAAALNALGKRLELKLA